MEALNPNILVGLYGPDEAREKANKTKRTP